MFSRLFKRKAEVQITKEPVHTSDTIDLDTPATGSTPGASEARACSIVVISGRKVKAIPRRRVKTAARRIPLVPLARLLKRRAEVQITKDDVEDPVVKEEEEVRQGPLAEVEGRIVRGLPQKHATKPSPATCRDLNRMTLKAITEVLGVDFNMDISDLLIKLAKGYKDGLEEAQKGEVPEPVAGPSGTRGEESQVSVETKVKPEETVRSMSFEEPAVVEPAPIAYYTHQAPESSGFQGFQTNAEAGPSTPPLLFGGLYGPYIPLAPLSPRRHDFQDAGRFDFGAMSGVPAEMPRAVRDGTMMYRYYDGRWRFDSAGLLKLLTGPRRIEMRCGEGNRELVMKVPLTAITEFDSTEHGLQFMAPDMRGRPTPYALGMFEQKQFVSTLEAELRLALEHGH